jgi:hypothetical protein
MSGFQKVTLEFKGRSNSGFLQVGDHTRHDIVLPVRDGGLDDDAARKAILTFPWKAVADVPDPVPKARLANHVTKAGVVSSVLTLLCRAYMDDVTDHLRASEPLFRGHLTGLTILCNVSGTTAQIAEALEFLCLPNGMSERFPGPVECLQARSPHGEPAASFGSHTYHVREFWFALKRLQLFRSQLDVL